MRRLFFQLIFIIISSVLLSACDNSQQAQKDKDAITTAAPQDNDCLDQNTSDSNRLDTIGAQGCPIK